MAALRLWETIAAPGTEPSRLVAAVVRRAGRAGGPSTIAKQMVTLTSEAHDVTLADVVQTVAPAVSASAIEAIEPIGHVWAEHGVRVAVLGDPSYPRNLLRGWDRFGPPLFVAWRGPERGVAPGPCAAIVGARRATGYGTGVAAWLAEAASRAGVLVASGGAVGIDAAAHSATAGVDSGTVVVLGCGHDIAYPSVHARTGGLFDRILGDGGWLISEQLPGTQPRAANVLARNRIVAGLADAVVVVEGGARSGALNTASLAADRGVPVLAVPGDVRATMSAAPHRLLREGAQACVEPADLLEALDVAGAQAEGQSKGLLSVLDERVHAELASRWPRPTRLDELAAATRTQVGPLLAQLTRARIAGEVADGHDGVRLTRAPR